MRRTVYRNLPVSQPARSESIRDESNRGLRIKERDNSGTEQRLRLHKYHNQLLCRYQPDGPISAKIAFIKAEEGTAFDKKMKDPVSDWSGFTAQDVIERQSPGNHFNMFSNEYSPILADALHLCIRDILNPQSAQ